MTAVSLQTLHALGWTLLHFVWQGAALAALLAAALMVSRNANVRYALGIGTLILMLAAPVVTFSWLNRAPSPVAATEAGLDRGRGSIADGVLQLNRDGARGAAAEGGFNGEPVPDAAEAGPDRDSSSDVTTAAAVTHSDGVVTRAVAPALDRLVRAVAASTNREDMMLWLVQAWFVGVMLLSLRTAGGLFWLSRTRRDDIEPLSPEMLRKCEIVQQRMGLQRYIRYGQSRSLDSPVVVGWFRPIVLVTAQAMTGLSPQQLQAIIAHELAHIRRHDAFVNLFQIAAEMFLFYHPAVWWVSRRIRIEREVCCDHEALAACGEPVSYARALTMMEEWRAAPSMMMAANRSPLAERVLRLLGMQGSSARSRAAGLSACVLGVVAALFAGSVFVAAAQAAEDDRVPTEPAMSEPDIAAPPAPAAAASAPAPAPAPEPKPALQPKPAPAPDLKPAPDPKPAPRLQMAQAAQPAMPARPAEPPRAPVDGAAASKSSYIQSIKAAGLQDVDIDQVIAMKVHGITPEYIKGVRATNPQVDADQLIAMKVHDVTPEYIEEIRGLVADVDIEHIIAMKVHDITPQYIREMQASGFDIRLAEDFIGAKVQGITPEFIKRAVEHGFQDLTIQKLMMLRNIDVI